MNALKVHHPTPRRPRFSLLEVLIAVAIIALVGGVAAFNLFPQFFKAQRDKAGMDITVIEQAISSWRLDHNGALPDSLDQLLERKAERRSAEARSGQARRRQVARPVGSEYVYNKISTMKFEIISYGADKAPGGDGDNADISSIKNKSGN
jgi:general secretion pathway protein G